MDKNPGTVTIRAYAELNDFLPRDRRQKSFSYPLRGGHSLKHLIESAGIPHTEVEVILKNGISVGLDATVDSGTGSGGTLTIEWDGAGKVMLSGPAELVFVGEWPD